MINEAAGIIDAGLNQSEAEREHILGSPLDLTYTSNRRRMISVAKKGRIYVVRLNHEFVNAGDEIITALAAWLKKPKNKPPEIVRNFIDGIPEAVRKRKQDPIVDKLPLFESGAQSESLPAIKLSTKGQVHDLKLIANQVNEKFFNSMVTAGITWGRDTSNHRVQTRRLGAYYRDGNLIVIHPVLDDPRVPIIEFTIYHEMLHSLQSTGSRPHDREFRKAERKHPLYAFVQKWQKDYSYILNGGISK